MGDLAKVLRSMSSIHRNDTPYAAIVTLAVDKVGRMERGAVDKSVSSIPRVATSLQRTGRTAVSGTLAICATGRDCPAAIPTSP